MCIYKSFEKIASVAGIRPKTVTQFSQSKTWGLPINAHKLPGSFG